MRPRQVAVSLSLALAIVAVLVWWTLSGGDGDPSRDASNTGTSDVVADDASDRAAGGAQSAAIDALAGVDAEALAPEAAPIDAPEVVDDRPVSIEGVVRDRAGAPVVSARVVAIDDAALAQGFDDAGQRLDRDPLVAIQAMRASLDELAADLARAETGDEGRYRLRGLAPGEHRVVVAHPDFLVHRDEVRVEVRPGVTAQYDVVLEPATRIAGRVVDASGEPIEGALVSAQPAEFARLRGIGLMVHTLVEQIDGRTIGASGEVRSDADGHFELGALEWRVHDLRAEKDGYAWRDVADVPPGSDSVIIVLSAAAIVRGRLLSPDDEPVSGAQVVLRQPHKDLRRANPMAMMMADLDVLGARTRDGASDADGRFALGAFRDGSYELELAADGYPKVTRAVRIAGEDVDLGDIALERGRPIAGVVLGPGDVPLADVDIEVSDAAAAAGASESGQAIPRDDDSPAGDSPAGFRAREQSDAGGRFEFGALRRGSYRVEATSTGFVRARLDAVEAGTTRIELRLVAGLVARGRVLGVDGEPLAGARVEVNGRSRDGAETDDDGRFEIAGIEASSAPAPGGGGGNVGLIARHPLCEMAFESRTVDRLDDIEFRLRRRRLIAGVVRDPDGRPVAGARLTFETPGFPSVMLRFSPDGAQPPVRSDAEGRFETPLPGQIPGDAVEIVALHAGFAPGRSAPIPSRGGGEPPFVEIVLGAGGEIEGRVHDLAGQPVGGAYVRALRDVAYQGPALIFAKVLPPSTPYVGHSSADGTFRISGVELGSYRLLVEAVGFAAETVSGVEVIEGVARVDVELDSGGSLEGRVVDLDGRGVPGIEVVAIWSSTASAGNEGDEWAARNRHEAEMFGTVASQGVANARTGEAGNYTLERLPAGKLRVVARAKGCEPAVSEPIERGERPRDLVLAPLARIVGRVFDAATGAPVRPFELRLERKYPGTKDHSELFQHRRSVDDPAGRFAIDELESGDLRLIVRAPGYVEVRRRVELQLGEEAEVEIALDSGETIVGRARVATSNAPVVGARVRAEPVSAREARSWERAVDASSGDDGSFELRGLESGLHRVSIGHPDYFVDDALQSFELELPTADGAPLDVAMYPAGRLRGVIDGVPSGGVEQVMVQLRLDPVARSDESDASTPGPSGESTPANAPGALRAHTLWVRPDGSFEGSSLRPGRYVARLFVRDRSGGAPADDAGELLGEVTIVAGREETFRARRP